MIRPRRRSRFALPPTSLLASLSGILAIATLVHCSNEERAPAPGREQMSATASARPVSNKRPVDADLVAFLSKARAAHHAGDLAESQNQIALAIEHVEMIPNGPIPARTPEVKEVLADAHARLADLKSRIGLFDEALRDIERGLAIATETTHFRGHLFEVRGLVEERRMKALEAKGDTAGAAKARQQALEAFEKAIEIQDEVIMNALPDSSGTPATSAPPSALSSAPPSALSGAPSALPAPSSP